MRAGSVSVAAGSCGGTSIEYHPSYRNNGGAVGMAASSLSNRVLEIADAPSIAGAALATWADVAEAIPESFAYSCIVVVPAFGSEETQRQLLGRLRSESHLGQWRVVWVLNEHSIAEVGEPCGIGRLMRRELSNGIVTSAFRTLQPTPSQIRFLLEDLSPGTVPVAHWQSGRGAPPVPVAALSSDLRWVVTPPAPDLSAIIELRPNVYRSAFAAASVLLLAAIVALAWYARSNSRAAYATGTSAVAEFDTRSHAGGLATPDAAAMPAARLAERLISSQRSLNMLRLTIKEASGSSLSPEELWTQSQLQQSVRSPAFFRLALLSGDLVSAYRIVLGTDFKSQDRYRWTILLTETFWQTAVESLQELDFRRAHIFAELYLASLDQVFLGPDDHGEIGPERNRTLARILLRESRSGRIKSLCHQPALASNFGRLLGGEWGTRIEPVSSREREERIRKNRLEQCHNVPPSVTAPYDALIKADDFYAVNEDGPRFTDYSDLAQLVPLEHKYLRARALLADAAQGPRNTEAATAGLIALLEVARTPSYLADDALYTAAGGIHAVELQLPATAVDRALAVIDASGGDYAVTVRKTIAAMDCERIDWRGFRSNASTSATMGTMGTRCGH